MTARRQFVLASALCASAPSLFAQARSVRRVGVLHPGSAKESPVVQREPFERGLRELGWMPGSNLLIEYRYAEGDPAKLRGLADDLVRAGVDVIVARANPAIAAARNATSTTAIVMSSYAGDPMADGVVNNASRPGGNVSGLASLAVELNSKRLQLLKEAFPQIRRVGVVSNPALDGRLAAERMVRLRADAQSLGLQLLVFEIRRLQDIDALFAEAGSANLDGLYVRGDPQILDQNRRELAAFALKLRLPAIYEWPFYVDAGGLMSYGDSISAIHHRSASYVSRILKGEKVGDLPIEQPSKFDLVVNLNTARAMGVEVPKTVMFRASRIVE
jgi:putative tryptophan/tyrosine transport system substrate-binding protein